MPKKLLLLELLLELLELNSVSQLRLSYGVKVERQPTKRSVVVTLEELSDALLPAMRGREYCGCY